jgi:hypothetical protein
VGCASTSVRVEQAAEFHPAVGSKVSILGVFHDGHMSESAWKALSPKVSAMLGHTSCEIGYGSDLRESSPELAASFDKQIRENGVDDAVIDSVAPNASGDLVMILMSYRQIPEHRAAATAPRPASAAPLGGSGGGRFGRRGGSSGGRPYVPEEEHLFELSASLFSVSLHKLVAQVDLRYDGDDLDEAMDAFTKKLAVLVPQAKCVGWHWPPPEEHPVASPPPAEQPNN